jgi:glucosylceramidase
MAAAGALTVAAAPTPRLWISGGEARFADSSASLRVIEGKPSLTVERSQGGKPIEGFGGAFNEKGWVALASLSEEDRQAVLRSIFEPGEGLGLIFGRIPIGSSDYALSRYSLDDAEGDYAMERFSIDRDRRDLLPYVKAAQAIAPSLRFWASAWSPPPWMKSNRDYDSGSMRDDPLVYKAYALYLAKFVAAYAAEGVPIEAVAVQNEPTILTNYPSCSWKPTQFALFVGDYLGPTLAQLAPQTGVLLGTFQAFKERLFASAVLQDPKARAYVKVLGLQWGGLPIAEGARKLSPGLAVWQTETDCGNHHWEAGFDPDKPQNDFAYAAYTWKKMRDYLAAGSSMYSLWNIVLDEEGKSIDAIRPWPQNSPIVIDRQSNKAIYTPMYYAFGHFSRYLPAGSVLLESRGDEDAMAFGLPDGSLAIVAMNEDKKPRSLSVATEGGTWAFELPPQSFCTFAAP